MIVPRPSPFIVMTLSSLSGVSSCPENSTRMYSMTPLESFGSGPPNGMPTSPSARHSPPGQLTGALPLIVRPPQSPVGTAWPWPRSRWLLLVMMIGPPQNAAGAGGGEDGQSELTAHAMALWVPPTHV